MPAYYNIQSSLALIAPELLLVGGALFLLVLSSFRKVRAFETTMGVSLALLIGAGAILVLLPWNQTMLFDGALRFDAFGNYLKLLIYFSVFVALVMSIDNFRTSGLLKFEYPILVLLATTGMSLMASAGNLISLYLAMELQSLALYVLASFQRDSSRSTEAGLKYFVLGSVATCLFLFGASLVYGFVGSTDFVSIAPLAMGGDERSLPVILGLVFLMVAFAFKVSAVPFHMWTPDVYEGAPTPVTALFASAPKLAAMAVFVRVMHQAFPDLLTDWRQVISILAILSMVLGAFAAIGQTNIKRLLAYSSIGHMGFALVGLATGSPQGVSALLIYLSIYVVMTLGSFAFVSIMRREDGPVEDISALSGLYQSHPWLTIMFTAMLFSLAGVPPLLGFFAKWYVFMSAVDAGLIWLAVLGLLASVPGLYYYLRIVKIMFLDEPRDEFVRAPFELKVIVTVVGLAMIGVIFILNSRIDDFIGFVANSLFQH